MTVRFRGVPLAGTTPSELTHALLEAVQSRRGMLVTFMNPHSYNVLRGSRGAAFRQDLERMDFICVDGIGVVWVVRLLLRRRLDRLSFDLWAPGLLTALAERGSSVFLVGGRPGVAREAGRRLGEAFPGLRIAGALHGFPRPEDLDELARRITASGAEVVLIGAGAPVQERLAVALAKGTSTTVASTCGGYFDQVCRAGPYYPQWAYPLRLNWVVRLYREPARLWRRYLWGNPRFLLDSLTWWVRRTR